MGLSRLGILLSMLSVSTRAGARGTCSLHAICTSYCPPLRLVFADEAIQWLVCVSPAYAGTGCAVCTCMRLLFVQINPSSSSMFPLKAFSILHADISCYTPST